MIFSSHDAEASYTGVDFVPTNCTEKKEMAEKKFKLYSLTIVMVFVTYASQGTSPLYT